MFIFARHDRVRVSVLPFSVCREREREREREFIEIIKSERERERAGSPSPTWNTESLKCVRNRWSPINPYPMTPQQTRVVSLTFMHAFISLSSLSLYNNDICIVYEPWVLALCGIEC